MGSDVSDQETPGIFLSYGYLSEKCDPANRQPGRLPDWGKNHVDFLRIQRWVYVPEQWEDKGPKL